MFESLTVKNKMILTFFQNEQEVNQPESTEYWLSKLELGDGGPFVDENYGPELWSE